MTLLGQFLIFLSYFSRGL